MLPHNRTIGLPGPKQIVELQNRREYELFGMVHASAAAMHQRVFRHMRDSGGQVDGVWAWNGSGGWGGGRAALGREGWSVWTELSSALTAALARDAELDTAAFVRGWCAEKAKGIRLKTKAEIDHTENTAGIFIVESASEAEPSAFWEAVADLYLDSESIIERGWYLGDLGRGTQALGGTYLPSLLWVWWMRPTASLIFWAYLAAALPDAQAVLRDGREALARAAQHARRLEQLAPPGDERGAAIVASARYLRDALAVAQAIRGLLLPALGAAWRDDGAAWERLAGRVPGVRAVLRAHRAAWSGNQDLPPLELGEMDAFLARLERAPGLVWRQAGMACLAVRRLRGGQHSTRHVYAAGMGAATLLLALLMRKSRRTAGIAGALASGLMAGPVRRRALRVAVPFLSRRLFLLPSIFFETGPSFTEWTA
jgi:hypothetical protein